MPTLPLVKPASIRQTVLETLRRALLEGRFQAGQPLTEAALAAQMNISRGPVREALFALAQEGLVSHSQNYGFSVLEFSEEDRNEVRQLRLPLETLALELARGKLATADVDQLNSLTRTMVQGFLEQRYVESTQADLDFHILLWHRSGNKRLVAALRTLMVPYFAYGSAFRISRPDLTAQLLGDQHAVIVEYLTGASTRTAEDCVRFHLGL